MAENNPPTEIEVRKARDAKIPLDTPEARKHFQTDGAADIYTVTTRDRVQLDIKPEEDVMYVRDPAVWATTEISDRIRVVQNQYESARVIKRGQTPMRVGQDLIMMAVSREEKEARSKVIDRAAVAFAAYSPDIDSADLGLSDEEREKYASESPLFEYRQREHSDRKERKRAYQMRNDEIRRRPVSETRGMTYEDAVEHKVSQIMRTYTDEQGRRLNQKQAVEVLAKMQDEKAAKLRSGGSSRLMADEWDREMRQQMVSLRTGSQFHIGADFADDAATRIQKRKGANK